MRTLLSGFLAAVVLVGCSIERKPPDAQVMTIYPVAARTIRAVGMLVPVRETSVFAPRDGVIDTVAVTVGDRITKGQTIATLRGNAVGGAANANAAKQRQLEVAQRQLSLAAAEARRAEDHAQRLAQQRHEQSLAQVDSQLQASLIARNQNLKAAENASNMLVGAVSNVLYEDATVIDDFDKHTSTDYSRRPEVFYPHEGTAKAVEQQLLDVHRSLSQHSAASPELLTQAMELGRKSRALVPSLEQGLALPELTVLELRDDVDQATEAVIRTSSDYLASVEKVDELRRQKELLEAKGPEEEFMAYPRQVVLDRERDVQLLQAEVSGGGQSGYMVGAQVRSPLSGLVSEKHASDGDAVGAVSPIVTITDTSRMLVRFGVSEYVYPFVTKGMTIAFFPTAQPQKEGRAVITKVSPTVDPQSRLILVEADVASGSFLDGVLSHMQLTVDIPMPDTLDLLAVPQRALRLTEGEVGAWVVTSRDRSLLRPLRVAFRHGGMAYVQAGLTPEERVVVGTSVALSPSLRVEAFDVLLEDVLKE